MSQSVRSISVFSDIKLFPPDLQVQVERQYEEDKGLKAGETRNYRVGSEGPAFNTDQYRVVNSQWLYPDGSVQPSELSCYTPQLDGHTNGFQTSLKSNSMKSFVFAVANLSIP